MGGSLTPENTSTKTPTRKTMGKWGGKKRNERANERVKKHQILHLEQRPAKNKPKTTSRTQKIRTDAPQIKSESSILPKRHINQKNRSPHRARGTKPNRPVGKSCGARRSTIVRRRFSRTAKNIPPQNRPTRVKAARLITQKPPPVGKKTLHSATSYRGIP